MGYFDCKLFEGISREDYEELMRCFHPTIRMFQSGEDVYSFGSRGKAVGVVRRGSVSVVRTDVNGVRTLLEHAGQGEIFGDIFYEGCIWKNEITITCDRDCEIMFIDYYHITKRCVNACIHHSMLVQNMLSLVAARASALSEHIEVLSCRSIREKLLAYFTLLSARADSERFELPFSFAALADYLCVDRSAMMRELKKLKDGGLVRTDRRSIELLKELPAA